MKVMIGLSGGVDSAVAAYLLQQQGHEVVAGFMRNWDALANNDTLGNPTLGGPCPQELDYQDAVAVAKKLGIPLFRCDYVKEYWDNVFTYFLKEYEQGRTPNPDVFCNKYIKFGPFLEFARSQGCEKIAMGHYAKKVHEEDGLDHLYKAHDKSKDQSYFLSQISEEQIASCLFPLADIDKLEVRRIAHELGLESVMDKKDSTGICFIGERNFRAFLSNYFPAKKGDIVEGSTGKVVGTHKGVLFYTLGQHKGLGIGGIKGEEEGAFFIYKKDVKKNILYVAHPSDRHLLLSDACLVTGINWIGEKPKGEIEVGAKFRYRQPDQKVYIHFEGDEIKVRYASPIEAVTPGQIAVFYLGEKMLGGGIIEATYREGKRIDL